MGNNLQSRKSLRLKGFDYGSKSHVYFVTLCTANRGPLFLDSRIAKTLEDEMGFRRAKKEIHLFCYCIMPDHLHLLLSLTNYPKKLQDWVSTFKRFTAKEIFELYELRPLWQKNFYDRIVRQDESLLEMAKYIINNPVRKGIASNWELYPYSKMIDPLPI
jgi:REP-associated tyrosine transposase